MTRILHEGRLHIEAEDDGVCEKCGIVAETRPYGAGGIEVCFKCGMEDEEEARRRYHDLLKESDD